MRDSIYGLRATSSYIILVILAICLNSRAHSAAPQFGLCEHSLLSHSDVVELIGLNESPEELIRTAGGILARGINSFILSQVRNGINDGALIAEALFDEIQYTADQLRQAAVLFEDAELQAQTILIADKIALVAQPSSREKAAGKLKGIYIEKLTDSYFHTFRDHINGYFGTAWGFWSELMGSFKIDGAKSYGVYIAELIPEEVKKYLQLYHSSLEYEHLLEIEIDVVTEDNRWVEIKNTHAKTFQALLPRNSGRGRYIKFFNKIQKLRTIRAAYRVLRLPPPNITYAFFGGEVPTQARKRMEQAMVEVLEFDSI